MNHFYQDIYGWTETIDTLYKRVVEQAKDGAHFVEVGAYVGKSAAFMAVEIINSGKDIKFDVVDIWMPIDDFQRDNLYKFTEKDAFLDFKKLFTIGADSYEIFLRNIESVKHVINPIKSESTRASRLYADKSLDFVYIDADHKYKGVKSDILAWLPKVKVGGVLAGHDYIEGKGVKIAVDELFDKKDVEFVLGASGLSSWVITKK